MARNTGFYILILVSFAQLATSSTTAAVGSTATFVAANTSSAAAKTSSVAANSSSIPVETSSPAAKTSSVASLTATTAVAQSTSFSVRPSSTVSVPNSVSPSPYAPLSTTVMPTSSIAQSSIASVSATPSLTSAVPTSSSINSSSAVPVSTSFASLVTPSRTAVMSPETIRINDKETNERCLTAKLEVDFKITYNAQLNGTKTKTVVTIPLNGDNTTSNVTGYCNASAGSAYFRIAWNEYGYLSIPKHTFTMKFELSSKVWNVSEVAAVFQTADSRLHDYGHNVSSFEAMANTSKEIVFGSRKTGKNYICDGKVDQKLSNNVVAMFQHIVLQPFSNNTNITHKGDHCAADQKSDDDDGDDNTVPIAVGAALGGLVLIVLIAYVIGRRRSNRGYEQV